MRWPFLKLLRYLLNQYINHLFFFLCIIILWQQIYLNTIITVRDNNTKVNKQARSAYRPVSRDETLIICSGKNLRIHLIKHTTCGLAYLIRSLIRRYPNDFVTTLFSRIVLSFYFCNYLTNNFQLLKIFAKITFLN